MREIWARFRYQKRATVALALLIVLITGSFAVHWLVIPDRTPHAKERFLPPSTSHLMGTDYAGRDTAWQVIFGARDVVSVSLLTGLMAVSIALVLGTLAALYDDRPLGACLVNVTDAVLTVPNFPVMAIAASLFQVRGSFSFALILAVWAWPNLARGIRAQVLSLKQRDFVEAAEMHAMGTRHVLTHEIFPNLLPYCLVHFIQLSRDAVAISVGIMLLGLVPLRVENWGMPMPGP